jgi:hypothetical protein
MLWLLRHTLAKCALGYRSQGGNNLAQGFMALECTWKWPTRRPTLLPENIPGTHFCQRLSQPHGQIATGMFLSMKNSRDTSKAVREKQTNTPIIHSVY